MRRLYSIAFALLLCGGAPIDDRGRLDPVALDLGGHQLDRPGLENPLFDFNPGAAATKAGVAALNPNLTLNGTTVSPTFRFKGGDADDTDLDAWGYGNDLAFTSGGTDPSYNRGSPLLGSDDDSVLFNNGDYYKDGVDDTGDIGSDDIVFELVVKTPSAATDVNQAPMAKRDNTGLFPGWHLFWAAASDVFQLTIDTGAAGATVSSPVLDLDTWYHLVIVVNRDEASTNGSRVYANAAAGTGVNMSATSGDADATGFGLIIGGAETGIAGKCRTNIAYAAMWRYPSWHQAGAAGPAEWDTVVAERFHRAAGTWPGSAAGTAAPTVATRASAAALDKLEAGVRKIYYVGDNWERVVSRTNIIGFLPEAARTNLILQSKDLSTSWTLLDAGDTISANALEAPDKTITVDGIIADATNGDHGVTQNFTATAAAYTFSAFLKAGDRDWALLSFGGSSFSYFDLAAGNPGTLGAGATSARMEDWGNGWYRCSVTDTLTAAVWQARVQTADADSDVAVIGNGIDVNLYPWGMQVEATENMSSHVPTTTVAATRAIDRVYFKGDDGNYDQDGGTIVVSYLHNDFNSIVARTVLSLSDGGGSADRIGFGTFSGGHEYLSLYSFATEAGSDILIQPTSTDAFDGAKHVSKLVFEVGSAELFEDGVSVGTDSVVGVLPNDIDRIVIGARYDNNTPFDGVIERVRIYK